VTAPAFITKPFWAGNTQAVRLPASMAFPPKTELRVVKDGNRLIIEPRGEGLGRLASLFVDMSDAAADPSRASAPVRTETGSQAKRPSDRPPLTVRR